MVNRWIGFNTDDYEVVKSFGTRLRVVKYSTGYHSLQVEFYKGGWMDVFITAQRNPRVRFQFQDLELIGEFIWNQCKSYLECDSYYELFNDNGFNTGEVPECKCASRSHISLVSDESCFDKYMSNLKKLYTY